MYCDLVGVTGRSQPHDAQDDQDGQAKPELMEEKEDEVEAKQKNSWCKNFKSFICCRIAEVNSVTFDNSSINSEIQVDMDTIKAEASSEKKDSWSKLELIESAHAEKLRRGKQSSLLGTVMFLSTT